MRECGEADGDCFALAPEINEGQGKEGTYGAVEFVAGRVKLGAQ